MAADLREDTFLDGVHTDETQELVRQLANILNLLFVKDTITGFQVGQLASPVLRAGEGGGLLLDAADGLEGVVPDVLVAEWALRYSWRAGRGVSRGSSTSWSK